MKSVVDCALLLIPVVEEEEFPLQAVSGGELAFDIGGVDDLADKLRATVDTHGTA